MFIYVSSGRKIQYNLVMDWRTDREFGEKVARLCIKKYSKLPKTGKPQAGKEWTLLAGVVICTQKEQHYSLDVVSIATGSKCVGKSKMSKTGEILNDSHAEVLTRRAFLRFVYSEVKQFYKCGESAVLHYSTKNMCRMKDGVTVHLYSSHTPCGDASIFPKQDLNHEFKGAGNHKTDAESFIGNMLSPTKEETTDVPSEAQNVGTKPSTVEVSNGKDWKVNRKDVKINRKDDNNIEYNEEVNKDDMSSGKASEIQTKNNIVTETSDKKDVNVDSNVNSKSTEEMNVIISTGMIMESENVNSNREESMADLDMCSASEISNRNVAISTDTNMEGEDSDIHMQERKDICRCETEDVGLELKRKRVKDETPCNEMQVTKQCKTGTDVYRTGAKCVTGGVQDPRGHGEDYHVTGAFRIKPGRGERTLSMSCSDKMARWNVVGCQGALLLHFLSHPIYFSSVTIGRCPYDRDAIQRAIVDHSAAVVDKLPTGFKLNTPLICQCQIGFEHSEDALMEQKAEKDRKLVPCSSSMAWFRTGPSQDFLDVTTHGRKHGVVTKNLHKPQARSLLCSKSLFDLFISVVEDIVPENRPQTLQTKCLKTYKDYKMAATCYQTAWQQLLGVYTTWEHKPAGHLDFT